MNNYTCTFCNIQFIPKSPKHKKFCSNVCGRKFFNKNLRDFRAANKKTNPSAFSLEKQKLMANGSI
jgi:hypothetical protein